MTQSFAVSIGSFGETPLLKGCKTRIEKDKKKMNTQTENTNQVLIKILGHRKQVLSVLKDVETLFPAFVEGKLNQNDDSNGVHVFLTVAVSAPAAKHEANSTAPIQPLGGAAE